jgi:hypothetical protein
VLEDQCVGVKCDDTTSCSKCSLGPEMYGESSVLESNSNRLDSDCKSAKCYSEEAVVVSQS